jgi:reverse transcriptase-like protein
LTRIQAFNEATLARHFTKNDFYEDPHLSDNDYRKIIIEDSSNISEELFPNGLNYNSFVVGSKKSFSISNLTQKLILRTCATHLNRSVSSFNKSRSQIARELRPFLADGTAYNIYRLDIKSFFESIEKELLEKRIYELKNTSMHTKKIASRVMDYFDKTEGICVPRGLETSSILSNLYLEDFDNNITAMRDVFFYSRFVDDILIISSNEQSTRKFKKEILGYLPTGLFLNPNKTKVTCVGKRAKSGNVKVGNPVAFFDYLGFRFTIIDSPLTHPQEVNPTAENKNLKKSNYRKVEIDLSPRKVKRLKEKICKAFYAFAKTNDYSLLTRISHEGIKESG